MRSRATSVPVAGRLYHRSLRSFLLAPPVRMRLLRRGDVCHFHAGRHAAERCALIGGVPDAAEPDAAREWPVAAMAALAWVDVHR